MEFLQQSFALVFVFTLLGVAVWFIKTKQRPNLGTRGQRRMQVVERVALTPQHTLCLVKIDGRLLMIGTAPSSCQLMESMAEANRNTIEERD